MCPGGVRAPWARGYSSSRICMQIRRTLSSNWMSPREPIEKTVHCGTRLSSPQRSLAPSPRPKRDNAQAGSCGRSIIALKRAWPRGSSTRPAVIEPDALLRPVRRCAACEAAWSYKASMRDGRLRTHRSPAHASRCCAAIGSKACAAGHTGWPTAARQSVILFEGKITRPADGFRREFWCT